MFFTAKGTYAGIASFIENIEDDSKLGFKKFNSGGISNITKPSKYKGLNEFKMSFNSKAIEYAGDFELITNKPLYFMWRNSKDISNMFKK